MWKTAEKNCRKTAETSYLENGQNILGCWKMAEISAVFQQLCWNRPVLGPQVLWSKDDDGNTASASSDKDYQRLLLSVV